MQQKTGFTGWHWEDVSHNGDDPDDLLVPFGIVHLVGVLPTAARVRAHPEPKTWKTMPLQMI